MSDDKTNETKQLCTFYVDGQLFGVDVSDVQEVIRHQEMTPVPLASGVVSGLINLRGRIVTALDLRRRFGLPPRDSDQLPTNVVVRIDDGIVSFLVDEIGDVVEVEGASFERPPETLASGAKIPIEGVYKLTPQLLLLLNTRLAAQIEAPRGQRRNEHA